MTSTRSRGGRRLRPALVVGALLIGLGGAIAYALGTTLWAPRLGGSMPEVAYDAYLTASRLAPTVTATCRVDWPVLAGIGQVESRHGRMDGDHRVSTDGDVVPPIRGPALDGTRGTERLADSDGGEFDGDPEFDRAMGPLQFIPTTWRELGRDANQDGIADPDNLYDASFTAVAHLCLREPGDYSDRAQLRRALIGYNASGRYADDVLAWINRYGDAELDEIVDATDEA